MGFPPAGGGGSGSGTVTSVSSADTSIAVATATTTPRLQLATLDVIAANDKPVAAVALNSQKITGLANGSGAQDAAAFGQIPTALPPNGTAGGDLSGTFPNPAVAKINGTALGTLTAPTAGQSLVWDGSAWQKAAADRDQLRITAEGLLSEPFNPILLTSFQAVNFTAIIGSAVGLRKGDVVTGIVTRNSVAAAGTLPTTARFGLLDKTGKVLVLTGNQNALANWAIGPNLQAFTGTYTVLADDIYYASMFASGNWGTTQPLPGLFGSADTNALAKIGANAPPNFTSAAGQTDFPAVGSTVTFSTVNTRTYYLACY